MELGGGDEGAAKRQEFSPSDAAAAGEDLLSALPDDVLVLILNKLFSSSAAQTSVLSHRWRRIWALLPSLSFVNPPEPHRLRDILDDHQVLLRDLIVGADGATPESLAVWLPAAARRVSGVLTLAAFGQVVEELRDYDSEEEEEEAAQRGTFEFPCFDKATMICFFLRYQGLAVPVTGVFARLIELHLKHVWFHGPGELGDAVSSPRCPCLEKLTIEDSRGLRDLAIHSESLLWMKLSNLCTLSQLIIVAPGLKVLIMQSCFVKNEPIADISAPLLSKFLWEDEYDPSSVHLGEMAHLQCLGIEAYLVYGPYGFLHNGSCLSLLKRFEAIGNLLLTLMFPLVITQDSDYLMKHMAVLPDITFLCLKILSSGHAFGASTFDVLRLCTGIRRLKLELANTVSEDGTICTSGCKCCQQVEWETEELLLNHLEEVEIAGFRGTEHEVAFVKQLFDWAIELKEMRVNFHRSISEVNAKDLYQTFQIFSRPGLCMKFYRYENFLPVLYEPND